jgi:hypothetical protein
MFFFEQTKQHIKNQFVDLWSKANEKTKGSSKVQEVYGWSLVLYRLAKEGIFKQDGLTPKQSAEDAELYEAFHFLSAENALDRLKNEPVKNG